MLQGTKLSNALNFCIFICPRGQAHQRRVKNEKIAAKLQKNDDEKRSSFKVSKQVEFQTKKSPLQPRWPGQLNHQQNKVSKEIPLNMAVGVKC